MRFPLARNRRVPHARHDTARGEKKIVFFFFYIMIIIQPVLETRIAPFPRHGRRRATVSSFVRFDVPIHNTRSASAFARSDVCTHAPYVRQSRKNVLYRFVNPPLIAHAMSPAVRAGVHRSPPTRGVPRRAGAFTVDPPIGPPPAVQ